MALTIAIEGKGVIANADAATNDTGGDGTGDWGFTGSGGVANGLTTDTYKYGSASIAAALSGTKNGWLWFNTGTGTGYPLDFSVSGAEEDQFIYIWIACPTLGLTATLANEGLTVRIGSSTSDFNDYTIGGTDGANGWDGAWKCFVIDPTKTASNTGGTINLASIQYIGARMSTTATAKGDNLFISQIAVGSGLRITGTGTGVDWQTVVDYCIDYPNRAWGMMQEREGIYYAYGNIYIGDTVMTGNCTFDDEGRVIQFGLSEYYESAAWKTSIPLTASGITLEDDNTPTTYTTTFTDGVIVGTDNGRSGSTIIGNTNENVFFNAAGLANTGSDINLYGTTFKSLAGAITLEGDTDHAYLGVNWIDCSQVDPVGGAVMRNNTFAETQDTVAALKWNNSIDLENSSFIANTTGAAIEHNDWNGSEDGTVTTADATGTQLTDTAATFTGNVAVNDIVYNETDNSFGVVTSVDSNSQLTHTVLTGGTDNDWDSSDAYSVTTPYTYTNLLFAGNTNDIDNTIAADNAVGITKSGTSDPSTFPTGDHVAIQGSVTVQITVIDEAGAAIQNAQTSVYLDSDGTQIMNEDTTAGGLASETYTGTTPADCYIRVRKGSTGATKYIPGGAVGTIETGTGLSTTITLRVDTNNAT